MTEQQQHAYITRVDDEDAVILGLVGEFDIATTDLMRTSLAEALATSSHLVLDLERTLFLDSTALGAMVGAGRRARESGGWVRLVAPPHNVRRVLDLTGIDQVFGLYDTVDQALTHVEEPDVAEA